MTLRPLLIAAAIASSAGVAAADNAPASMERWSPSAGDVIAFDVLRKGNEFGSHIVSFDKNEDGELSVTVDVDLKAGLGPITLFRYALDATETWEDGQLMSLQGSVNDDGSRESVTAELEGGALAVRGDGFSGEVDPSITPASHWNFDQVSAEKLLSVENGELIEVEVKELGRETIEAGGQSIEANKFMMDSDIDVTLWYDDSGRWLKLAFEARGQAIEYVLRDLY